MSYAVTVPDTLEMIVGEQLDLTVDFTSVLAGQVVDRALVIVANEEANEIVSSAIIGIPYFVGNVLHFTLSSTPLRRGSNYVVTLTGTNTVIFGVIAGPSLVISTLGSTFSSQEGVSMATILLRVEVIY